MPEGLVEHPEGAGAEGLMTAVMACGAGLAMVEATRARRANVYCMVTSFEKILFTVDDDENDRGDLSEREKGYKGS